MKKGEAENLKKSRCFNHFLNHFFMKRSKIYLGATTLVLAIVGVAATRATARFTVSGYYTTGGASHTCQPTGIQQNCALSGSVNCTYRTTPSSVSKQVFNTRTLVLNKTCKTLLKKI